MKYFLKQEFIDYVISIPKISVIQRVNKNKFLLQEKYRPSNSIGLGYVTDKKNYKTIMNLGDHSKVNSKYPMVLLPGNGGIQTINGRNVANSISFGHIYSYNSDTLKLFLNKNNYNDIDFKVLHIYKRNIFRLIGTTLRWVKVKYGSRS